MTLPAVAPVFEIIESVVVARFTREGRLVAGNAGFRRLCPEPSAFGWRTTMMPSPGELAHRPADVHGLVYSGLVTLGDATGEMRTLSAHAWVDGDSLLLIAGYDLGEFERVTRSMLDLNNALDTAHRDLIHAHRELAQREETIRKLSLTDPLTGLGNRRQFDEALVPECERARRYSQPLALMMFDLDHFKHVNDTHGHDAGDRVLRETGALLIGFVRQSDTAVRFGGEEFVVVMPSTTLPEAAAAAQRLRVSIEAHDYGLTVPVTASVGVATYLAAETPAQWLARADAALYRAKASGRNCVAVAPSEGGTAVIAHTPLAAPSR